MQELEVIKLVIKVCDMIMGAGKTSASINKMNGDFSSKYIFITPYLDEVERIKECCTGRRFKSPCNKGAGKLDNLHYLLGKGENIASTHTLFKYYNEYTLELILNGNYKLILDEVFDVVERVNITEHDLHVLIDAKTISIDEDGVVVWLNNEYKGEFNILMNMAKSGNLIVYDDILLFWTFPIEVFKAFKEVTILTYMFDAQIQKYYYDCHNVEIQYIGTHKTDIGYEFTSEVKQPEYVKELQNKIHILQDHKLNLIGDYEYALSSSWFKREQNKKQKPLIKRLKNNLVNIFRQRYKGTSEDRLWTTYKDVKGAVSGAGYSSCFISCNVRATNEYRHKIYLAYCVNVYFNPVLKQYFLDKGITVLEDKYALSEMIQWIWRSAIRDGKEIWIYIPSKRMRNLLEGWLENLANS